MQPYSDLGHTYLLSVSIVNPRRNKPSAVTFVSHIVMMGRESKLFELEEDLGGQLVDILWAGNGDSRTVEDLAG